MKFKACIFDLDGTLLETRASIARPVNMTLAHFGLSPRPVEMFGIYTGDGIETCLRRALADAGDPEGECFDEGIVMCRRWYHEDPAFEVTPYPHMPETLRELKKRGVILTVLTNKPHENTPGSIEPFYGSDLFDYMQGAEEGRPIKPDPAGVFEILRRFNLQKEDVIYIGDTNTDMKTAHAAGVFAVGVTWGFRDRAELEENNADRIIDDPRELLEGL